MGLACSTILLNHLGAEANCRCVSNVSVFATTPSFGGAGPERCCEAAPGSGRIGPMGHCRKFRVRYYKPECLPSIRPATATVTSFSSR